MVVRRNPAASVQHQNLIAAMVKHYLGKGCRELRADIGRLPRPAVIDGELGGFKPDLTCVVRGIPIIVEAETADSLRTDHTSKQFLTFFDCAREIGGRFEVIVPRGSQDDARDFLAELGIPEGGVAIWHT